MSKLKLIGNIISLLWIVLLIVVFTFSYTSMLGAKSLLEAVKYGFTALLLSQALKNTRKETS